MIYEFTRPGESAPFVSANNPDPRMLAEIKEAFPGIIMTSRWSCPVCYIPDQFRDYTNIVGNWRLCECGWAEERK